jgi:CMP-N-acetylneuraminic acid synthetase
MKIIAFTPIRAGSKGIPNKSLIRVRGIPVFQYSISSILAVKKISQIFVATDGENIKTEIQKVFTDTELRIIDRPLETCTDEASSESILIHFAKNYDFDVCVFFQITNLFFTEIHIQEALCKYLNTRKDIISVSKTNRFFFHNGYSNYDLYKRPRRQDIKFPTYIENGAFYISSRTNILKSKNRVTQPIQLYVMPSHTQYELDSEMDLHIVSTVLKYL